MKNKIEGTKNIDRYLSKRKTEVLNIRVTKTMKDFLVDIAKVKGTSVSDVIIACVEMTFSGEDE